MVADLFGVAYEAVVPRLESARRRLLESNAFPTVGIRSFMDSTAIRLESLLRFPGSWFRLPNGSRIVILTVSAITAAFAVPSLIFL